MSVSLPSKLTAMHGDVVKIEATTDRPSVAWIVPDALNRYTHPTTLPKTLVLTPHVQGTFEIYACAAQADVPLTSNCCLLTVTAEKAPLPIPLPFAIPAWLKTLMPYVLIFLATVLGLPVASKITGGTFHGCSGCSWPIPVPPIPPGPVPPVPPVPPTPPAPIPVAGLHVLMVYDAPKVSSLPKEQAAVLASGELRSYLNAHCPPGTDGKTKEWRLYDQHTDTSNESQVWKDAMARPRASVPWWIVSNGKTGEEGPLPSNVADAMATLKKYGGG